NHYSTRTACREATMQSRIGKILTLAGGLAAVALLAGSVARAQSTEVAGEYECTQSRVAGKELPCKAAPLSLKSDGHFELQGREGEYLVNGSWVVLNGTVLKSRA